MLRLRNGLLELRQNLDLALVVLVDLRSSLFDLIVDKLLQFLWLESVDDLRALADGYHYIEHELPVDYELVNFVRQIIIYCVRTLELIEYLLQ